MSPHGKKGTLPAISVPDDVEIEVADVAGEKVALLSWPLAAGAGTTRSVLSATEEAILRSVAMGLSNAAIAKQRGTSPRTVANQVASLLKKFRVGSRYELVVAMSRRTHAGRS